MKATSSKGRSPWKVRKGTRAGGIVIPKGAIVVNQGLGKVKLEEDFVDKKPDLPLSMEVEEDANNRLTITDADAGGEVVTEEHVVVKVEAEIPLSSEETPAPLEEDGNGSLSFYRDEIEALKCTVRDMAEQIDKQNEAMKKQDEENKKRDEENKKRDEANKKRDEENKKRDKENKNRDELIKTQNELIKVMNKMGEAIKILNIMNKGDEVIKKQKKPIKKQNEIIGGKKSFNRRIGLSMTNYCSDGEEDDGRRQRCSDSQSQEKTPRSVGEASVPFEIPSGSPCGQNRDTQDNSEEEGDHSSENLELIGVDGTGCVDETGGHTRDASSNISCEALESSSTCTNWQSTQNDNIGEGKDNQEDHQGNEEEDLDGNDDSSQVLPSSSNRKKEEDDDNPRGNAMKRRCLPRRIDRIRRDIRDSEGKKRFKCSKCNSRFKLEIMMQDHQRRVHSKVKPSKSACHLCRKVFSDYSNLRRHILFVHEGVRFKCEYCPREFTVIKNVRYHEDTVHKGISQTHPCEVCGKNLATSDGLQKHMKKIHENMSGSKASIATQKKRVERLRKKK